MTTPVPQPKPMELQDMRSLVRALIITALATAGILWNAPALSQDNTLVTRPIRLVSPFAPGGGNDVVARIAGQRLSELLGKPVIADNRPGANGLIGTELVSTATPDGLTLVVVSTSYVTNPNMQKPGFAPLKYLAPVALIAESPLILSANPSLPAKSIQELIALAKAKPSQLGFASAGVGNITHLAGELLQKMANISLLHVPYKGTALALTDVFGGQVPMVISSVNPVLGHLKSGRLRGLGVFTATRSRFVPDIPTVAESGVPKYEARVWWGIMGPGSLPKSLVNSLNADIAMALAGDNVSQRFSTLGMDVIQQSPDAFAKIVIADIQKWGKLAQQLGISEK